MELLQRSRHQDLRNCLEMEYNLAKYCSQGKADFFEGVRAMLVDKDKNPSWKHKTIWEVSDRVLNLQNHGNEWSEKNTLKHGTPIH